MPFKIVRNDITKMNTEAIVNTANDQVTVGTGCDHAVYEAAGREELLAYREKYIGVVPEGDAFITPGFNLKSKYIIHAVSPFYVDGDQGEEKLLRSCYQKSLTLAKENNIKSIAFPLISTGGFGYPKEEGMRIAVDEINAFLLSNEMDIRLVVFDSKATELGEHIYPELEAYIDHNYVLEKRKKEYSDAYFGSIRRDDPEYDAYNRNRLEMEERLQRNTLVDSEIEMLQAMPMADMSVCKAAPDIDDEYEDDDAIEELEGKLSERLAHMSDTFSQYLLYLIQTKGMENAEVYKRAIVDKKTFSKIKNNPDYHPQKITALCLCVGARLNLDETKDLLARAGYALSPCDMTDIIFSFFIEHEHFDIIDIDIQLEEHGLACIIS